MQPSAMRPSGKKEIISSYEVKNTESKRTEVVVVAAHGVGNTAKKEKKSERVMLELSKKYFF